MNNLLHRLREMLKRPGLWNIGRLMTASVFAQVISIVIAPVVTRLYSAAEYGFLALVISFSSMIGTFATLQYHQTIILPKEDEDAKVAMALSIWVAVGVSLLTALVLLATFPFLNDWFQFESRYRLWFFLVPVLIFFSALSNIASMWSNRKQQYKSLSQARMLSSLGSSMLSVGLGFLIDGPTGLMVGFFASYLILAGMLWGKNRKMGIGSLPMFEIHKLRAYGLEYKGFPLMTLPSEFITIFLNQLPIFMLTSISGPAGAGLYSLCNRILATPINMVASSAGELFRQQAAAQYAALGNSESVFRKYFIGLAGFGFLPFFALTLISPWLFAFVFGQEWREAGVYAQVLSFMFFFRFCVSPIANMYYIANRLREDFLVHVYLIASSLLTFELLKPFSIPIVLFGFALNYSLVYIFVGYRSWQFSKGI